MVHISSLNERKQITIGSKRLNCFLRGLNLIISFSVPTKGTNAVKVLKRYVLDERETLNNRSFVAFEKLDECERVKRKVEERNEVMIKCRLKKRKTWEKNKDRKDFRREWQKWKRKEIVQTNKRKGKMKESSKNKK